MTLTRSEVLEAASWLTGYTAEEIEGFLESSINMRFILNHRVEQ